MTWIFYKNPRVIAIDNALAELRMVPGISWIVAEYAWHSDNYNLSLALKDLSRADGSGIISFGDRREGSWWEHARITWTAEESDYEKKEYIFHVGIHSRQLYFSQLFPDYETWVPRKRVKSKYGRDIIKENYVAIVKPVLQKYTG